MKKPSTTHFGFTEVPLEEKTQRVREVFDSVASRYDVMNDLMSFGLHRGWKKYLIETAQVKPYDKILDLAGGTGDLSKKFLQKLDKRGAVYLADINFNMLSTGRDRFIDEAGYSNYSNYSNDSKSSSPSLFYIQTDAQQLPFPNNTFDKISIGFGLRNITDKETALNAMYHTLKPGGMLLVLEFSTPVLPFLEKIYDRYSFSVLPKLGELITGSRESYQYLIESIRKHPNQETLKEMILQAGFDKCDYYNLSGGIVCLHKAYKL